MDLAHFTEFCDKFSLQCSFREYIIVIKLIPIPFKTMTQQLLVHSNVMSEMRPLCVEGISLNSKQFTNKFVRNILCTKYYPFQLKRKYILRDYSNEEARKIRKQFLSFPLPPKAKEVTFKILNYIYPSNHFLHLKFCWENNLCVFCESDIETVEHVFFQLEPIVEFWLSFQHWLQSKGILLQPLNEKAGIFLKDKNLEFLIINLIVQCKQFIYRCKYLKVKPHINSWKN